MYKMLSRGKDQCVYINKIDLVETRPRLEEFIPF